MEDPKMGIFKPRLSARQLAVALVFGIAAAATLFTSISIPLGQGVIAEPSEIFVTLGSALAGPYGGLIVGFLQGVVYAPERNIPSHMLAGFLWGAWYAVIWRWTTRTSGGRWTRAALWMASLPVYYYVFLLPLHQGIASLTLGVPFLPLYASTAVQVIPEVAATLVITSLIMALLPEKYAKPIG
jgi:hypothetical protein